MAKGVPKVPTDPEELRKYRDRRKKNNESARKHRSTMKAAANESAEYKEKYELAMAQLKKKDKHIAGLENEVEILSIADFETAFAFYRDFVLSNFHNRPNTATELVAANPTTRGEDFVIYSSDSETADSSTYFIPNSVYAQQQPISNDYQSGNYAIAANNTSLSGSSDLLHIQYPEDDRPVDFDLASCTRRVNSNSNSANPDEYKWLEALIDAKDTGFTPLPGHCIPLADIAKMHEAKTLPLLDVDKDISPMVKELNLGSG